MQKARVDASGTELAYLDSGPPINSDNYSTLVIVHGHTYHAQNFSRLMSRASKRNVRIIALNRRDYVGSTLFTAQELEDVFSADATKHKEFLQARGLEIARFLVWVIEELKVPPRNSLGAGGLALLGWSLGNCTTIAFLSNLKTYPQDVLDKLRPYFSTFFIYECSYAITGHPHPEGAYHPLQDPDIPQRMKGVSFGTWLASYYSHPFHNQSPALKSAERALTSLELRIPKTHSKRPTNENISPSELLASIDIAPGTRSEHAFYGAVKPETLHAGFTGAFVLDEAENPASLPEVKVVYIYGTRSMWSVQYGVWQTEDDLEKWKGEGLHVRPFSFIKVDGGNHFIHWDDADEFMRLTAEAMLTPSRKE